MVKVCIEVNKRSAVLTVRSVCRDQRDEIVDLKMHRTESAPHALIHLCMFSPSYLEVVQVAFLLEEN